MSTIGIVCDNTCLNFALGDNTPDFLFGPAFDNLAGHTFSLTQTASNYLLTINGKTLAVPFSEITVADPSLGFTAGTLQFREILVNNPYGVAFEQEYLCPTPGVPEPATWLLMLAGLGILAAFKRR